MDCISSRSNPLTVIVPHYTMDPKTINKLNVYRESNVTLRNWLKQTEAMHDQKIALENELV